MKLTTRLRRMGACPEAVEWAQPYATLQEAWDACERADWMLWLIGHLDGRYSRRLRLAACACARTALRFIPAGEDRPLRAIETAERFARGEATDAQLATAWAAAGAAARAAARAAAWKAAWNAAWDAAWAAAWDAAWATAWNAAWNAARAAARDAAWNAARNAAWDAAWDAAWNAAWDAAWAAAWAAAMREMADLVRRQIPTPEVEP
jgi:hypothetical protein